MLTPLRPATTYHIVVAAQDAQGSSSFQTGTFRTPKVIDQIAANEPGGCSTACVRSALLKPRFGSPDLDVEVRTHVPTKVRVLANGEAIAGTGGDFVTGWDSVLKLQPGTTYKITLRVTDEKGRTQQHTAVVNTPKPAASHQDRVMVTFTTSMSMMTPTTRSSIAQVSWRAGSKSMVSALTGWIPVNVR